MNLVCKVFGHPLTVPTFYDDSFTGASMWRTNCMRCTHKVSGVIPAPHVHKWSKGYKNPHIGTSAYGHMPYIKHCTLDECIAIAPVKRRKVSKELP